jgi:dihydrofolate reductase
MSRLIVSWFSLSLDGYGAGPRQSLEAPRGVGGEALHDWIFRTQSFEDDHPGDRARAVGGETGIDDGFAARGMSGLGAWILGRNMFGPIRGSWPDDSWRGWWGQNPPYHVPVFVLTHHQRPPIEMEGGTVFHFVTEGIEAALERARAAAGPKDIRVGGGASTIRQYLQKRLIDQMHVAVAPVLLGTGEPLLAGLDLPALGYKCTESLAGERAVHYMIGRE